MSSQNAFLPEYVHVEYPRELPHGADAPTLSVIIPAYNEAERISPYLDAIHTYFAARTEAYEVLVANDGSSDHTAATVRARMKEDGRLGLVHYDRNRGKGHAVRMGMLAARGRLRLFADADGSTPITELERLRLKLDTAGFDVAVGSRQLSSQEVQRQIKPHRYFMGQCFRLLRRLSLNVSVLDSQCGFKLFKAAAAEKLFPASKIDGFAFDVELLFLAQRAELKVTEVAVNWNDSNSTRVNLLTDPFKMLRDMLRVRSLHRDTRFE